MKKFSICQRNKNQGSKIWYLREFDTDTHKIKYRSLDTTKKYEAEKALEHSKQKIYLNPNAEKIENLPPLKDLVRQWLDHTSATNRNNTSKVYKQWSSRFLEFCESQNITKFKEITTIQAYKLINEKQELKQGTRQLKRAVYRCFFNWIIETFDLEEKNVFSKLKLSKNQPPNREFWTLEQIRNILENENDKDYRLCYSFMAYAGLRVNEALGLTWGNISDSTLDVINGKGGKNATLPISRLLKDEIEKYRESKKDFLPNEKIFNTNELKVRKQLKKVCKKIGFDGLMNPHKFRHSFASNLLRNGANIVSVSKLMRHSTPSMTLNIYSHVLPNDLEKTLEFLEKQNTNKE